MSTDNANKSESKASKDSAAWAETKEVAKTAGYTFGTILGLAFLATLGVNLGSRAGSRVANKILPKDANELADDAAWRGQIAAANTPSNTVH